MQHLAYSPSFEVEFRPLYLFLQIKLKSIAGNSADDGVLKLAG